jgi:site-specific DNA recombinase
MRIAVYVRVSTRNQAEQHTIEQQLEQLLSHIQVQGWNLLDETIFRDDGYSGSNLQRPGLDHLRDQAAMRAFDLVLVTTPDRLARKYVHQALLIEELEQNGCQVQFLDRPISQDPHDQLLLQIRGAVAEYERTLISERMRRGRLSKYRAGTLLPWTRPPYGYRTHPERPRDPTGVRLDPAEAAVVAEIYATYLEDGMGLMSLARKLYAQRIPSPTGKLRWGLATLRGILTNPAYTGQVYACRMHYRPPKIRRSATHPIGHPHDSAVLAPQEEWIPVAEIPAIISQEQFNLVQGKLAKNQSFASRNNTSYQYLLRALVSCGICQLACYGRTPSGKSYGYYVCSGKAAAVQDRRTTKCPSRFIPSQQLDELVWQDLCDLLTHPEMIARALERAQGNSWLPQELQSRQENLRRGRVSLEHQLNRLTEAYLSGVIPLVEYERRRREIEERQQALENQGNQLRAQVNQQKELAGLVDNIEDFCQRVQASLANATFEQKRKLVELLIDRVVVTEADVEIRYVIPTSRSSEFVRFCQLRSDYFRHPKFVGTSDREVTLDQIRRRTGIRLALGGSIPFPATDALQFGRSHQPRHPLTTHTHILSGEFSMDARCAIGAFGVGMDAFDLLGQGFIFLRSPGRRPLQPRIVAAGGDFQNSTHRGNRVLCLVRFHELEDLSGIEPVSRANQAVAFARISRSRRNCLFSRRKRASSCFSSVVRPSWRCPSSVSACLTHCRMLSEEGSNSRASSTGVRPARTSSTICWRNSGG